MWHVGPFSDVRITDLFIYERDAGSLAAGLTPYSDAFLFEYPPLALVPIWLARALGGDYQETFGYLMLACGLGCLFLVRALGGTLAAWAFALTPLAAGAVLRTHYDLLAALALLIALLAFDRRRPVAGMALLGIGAMVKGFPLVLLPIAAAWAWRHRGVREAAIGLAACGVVVVALSAPFLGDGYLDAYRFHLDRPVQIESTPAVALYALGGSRVTGTTQHGDEFNSNGLRGGAAGAMETLFGLLALLTIALLAWLATLRREPEHLTLCLIAGVIAFVALGKVLSPQYVAWLAPLAAVLLGRRERLAAALLAAAVVLTQVEFPFRYFDLVRAEDGARLLVAARNAALLAALGVLIARALTAARSPRPSAVARPS
jgi:hypothetical protein